jgi:dihydrodipicolinate synthase/N-acetylneuraminate lyase
MIPALKHAVGQAMGDEGWRHVRPPLRVLADDKARALQAALAQLELSMEAA